MRVNLPEIDRRNFGKEQVPYWKVATYTTESEAIAHKKKLKEVAQANDVPANPTKVAIDYVWINGKKTRIFTLYSRDVSGKSFNQFL